MNIKVVKVGGAALNDASWLNSFARAAANAPSPLVVVHGGGPDITALSDRLGVEVRWHEGRRVTPPEALDVASMVLNGRVNKRLVAALIAAGVDAIGLSGMDGAILRADLLEGGALGCVGRVSSVRVELLHALIERGHTVVLSPISLGVDGGALNVNADDVAAAVAAALGADELVFLTDVPGVRDGDIVRSLLDATEAATLVRTGIAHGGMGVKLSAGVSALDCGVPAVRIGDASVLFDTAAGTVLRQPILGVA
jgi:acetylglutamate kinase